MLLIMLLREETISVVRRLLFGTKAILLASEDNSEEPRKSALELLEEAIFHGRHRDKTWRLYADMRASASDALATVSDLCVIADSCEWCMMPWGTDYPGLMVALIASDGHTIGQVIESLHDSGDREILVSHYNASDVATKRFRGTVFSSDLADQAVWRANECSTVHVFTAGAGGLVRKHMDGAQLIADDVVTDPANGISVNRSWLRISSIDAMRYYARYAYTSFFVGGISEENLSFYFGKSRTMGRDALRLGLTALRSAKWVYIPRTEAERDQIYIHQSPQTTAKLLADAQVAFGSGFVRRCFC